MMFDGCSLFQATTSDSARLVGFVVSENDSIFNIGSKIEILELNLVSQTDNYGRFMFNELPTGSYTLRVSSFGIDPTVIHGINIPPKDQPLVIMQRDQGLCDNAANQARDDLARGIIHLRAGGFKAIFLPAQKQREQIDEKYGIQWDYTGCSGNCDDQYNSIVMIYLTIRNGKDWWNRYQDEVKKVYESFRMK
jgi:hypothetical protein